MQKQVVRLPPMLVIAAALMVAVGCGRDPGGIAPPSWPVRPVRLVLPLAAGGGPDLVARTVGEVLSARWHQPVVIDNRPGGDGVVAARAAIDASDDHTLLFAPNSVVTANVVAKPSLPYSLEDLVPIASIVEVPIALVVGASSSTTSLADLIAAAKRAPGALTHATVFGAPQLIWARLLADQAIDMPLVGYRNPNAAIPDVMENRVHVALLPLGTVLPALKAGQVRVLAIMTARRSSLVPDVATIAEAGYPDYASPGALGLFAADETTPARRQWIAAEVKAALAEPALTRRLLEVGFEMAFADPAAYAAALELERTALRRMVR